MTTIAFENAQYKWAINTIKLNAIEYKNREHM